MLIMNNKLLMNSDWCRGETVYMSATFKDSAGNTVTVTFRKRQGRDKFEV